MLFRSVIADEKEVGRISISRKEEPKDFSFDIAGAKRLKITFIGGKNMIVFIADAKLVNE